ncbi:MAG: SpoIIE family protein phosphatase [bacterium]|nr:SpoIIE family protein phosphatase [bacterium]
MIKKSINLLIKAFGIFILVIAAGNLVHGILGIRENVTHGQMGIYQEWNARRGGVVLTSIIADTPAERAGLKARDLIIRINGQKLTAQNYSDLFGEQLAGVSVRMTIKRGEQILEVKISKELLPFLKRFLIFISSLLLPLLMMVYVFVGLWLAFKSNSGVANLIVLVCFTFGVQFYITGSLVTGGLPGNYFLLEVRYVLLRFSYMISPVFWLLLFTRFPERSTLVREHRKLTNVGIVFLPVCFFSYSYLLTDFSGTDLYDTLNFLYIVLYYSLGIMMISIGGEKSPSVLKKRQARLIYFGINIGMLSILVGSLGTRSIDHWYSNMPNYMVWSLLFLYLLSHVGGLLVPFTFYNVFRHKKLLETRSALKRRVYYFSATILLFLSYSILTIITGNYVVNSFKIREPNFIIIFTLMTAMTFFPLHGYLYRWIERKLFPEKSMYKKSLQELIKELQGIINFQGLPVRIAQWVEETLAVSPVKVFTLGNNGTCPVEFLEHYTSGNAKSIMNKTKDGGIFFWDELPPISGTGVISIDTRERHWAEENHISLTVPMLSMDSLVGLLHIGKRKDNEDFSGDDIAFFKEAASQTAVTVQSLMLKSDSLERERLLGELQMARRIQQRLLPQSIPGIDEVEGLALLGKSIPCQEVGGDYFDIIPLGSSRAILAVADVSGKGAGAAILMSNLQAALRSILRFSTSLASIAGELNRIICRNTDATQFITLFLGLWDNNSGEFQYMNAGHNPALVTGVSGEVRELTRTGIAMGIRNETVFSVDSVKLESGDILTLYSDGLEETFNEQKQTFGVERIIASLKRNLTHPPQKIMTLLLKEVEEFAGEEPRHDDLTVIVAKKE